MSYVAPSTILRILKGVPLESTYENTVFWDTAKSTPDTWVTQAEKFAEYTKPNVTDTDGTVYSFVLYNLTYQRRERNSIKVNIPADLLLDCNYMMFKNDRFGSKWFYAFITDAEYISETVTRLTYEIDVLQTWFFDYTPNACYIERAHANSDKIGENLVTENFELGEYVFKTPTTCSELTLVGYYIVAPWKADITYLEGGERDITITDVSYGEYISGIYSGIWINRFIDVEDVKAVIAKAAETSGDKSKAIVTIYCAPNAAGVESATEANVFTHSVTNDITLFGSYQAHNKKLYTYPYRGLQVFNGNGDTHTYMYEYFSGAKNISAGLAGWSCIFDITCDATPSGTCYLTPRGYKQKTGGSDVQLWYEGLSMGSYPTISWTSDAYIGYLAQDGVVQALGGLTYGKNDIIANQGLAGALSVGGSAIGGLVGGIMSAVSGNVAGGAVSALGGVASSMMENVKAQNMPNNTQGSTSSGQLKMKYDKQQFQFMPFTITEEFARKIDAFWDWFGYSQKIVKIPDRHARKWWTFIKTQGCTINGSIPADDERRICDLYNAGIRWWTDLSKVGDFYNLAADNTPILET